MGPFPDLVRHFVERAHKRCRRIGLWVRGETTSGLPALPLRKEEMGAQAFGLGESGPISYKFS